ncbi:unnamed protein product [Agarophyton chilense]|eukprot:gb/GEZJ01000374.1/.p1 GENE.gb/GEZJ01000374.1/~~gb/GEZJ01000374.1/.p1  ORF type:complete len:580 (+),score=118.01 gb/GEZJ01000374.1/:280-2019(+)
MSQHFDEAPPLPREPTALNVPAVMRPSAQQPEPLPSTSAPPPPKFPSLTDVALPSAQAAAASLHETQPAPTVEQATTQLDSNPVQEQTPFAMPLSSNDIRAAIERDSVIPGTGAKNAVEAGHSIWTDEDQVKLDRLLKEGQSIYVPPDVVSNDLMVSHTSRYIYVPVPAEGVDDFTKDSSVSSRINSWNQVVSKQNDKSAFVSPVSAAVGTAAAVTAAATLASSAPELTQPSSITHDRAVSTSQPSTTSSTPTDTKLESAKDAAQPDDTSPVSSPVDASTAVEEHTSPPHMEPKTATSTVQQEERAAPVSTPPKSFDAFSTFLGSITVPVKSHVPLSEEEKMRSAPNESEQLGRPTQVKLRNDATAEIEVVKDRGLRGGHDSKVNDAAFVNSNTLITCGDDGKVCIWDLEAEQVRKEFVPYDGQPVSMVHPIPDDDPTQSLTLMTVSKDREMRIWTVESTQAVMLRTTTIPQSDKDVYVSMPAISKDLKARAAAAVAAAAITTTDKPLVDTLEETADAPPAPSPPEETTPDEDGVDGAEEAADIQPEAESREEEKERKRFSLTKVLSFGRSGSRKAVAS